uniref:Uncharacterized protein n=3 Tax=Meloidogyne TaxID=189290 RepID=A0A914N0Y0_MELIC
MGNAIFRKIQTLPQLNQLYHVNEESRHKLRSFQALAFVPHDEVYTFFCILVEDFNYVEQPQILDLLRYFVLTWIGPSYVMQHPPIDPGQEDLNYGANVDAWIRAWIVNENLQNRMALFPIPLWNLTQRIENGLSRSNNSLEAWHHVWSSLLSRRPRLSQFIKRMLKEYTRWEEIVREFQNSPADGIRGKGIRRRAIYLNQDANLQQIYAEFEQRGQNPLQYLRTVSYRLARH